VQTKEQLTEEVSNDILKLMGGLKDKVSYDCLSYGIVKDALNTIGYYDNDDYDTNGWQVDYWNTFIYFKNPTDILYISGSMYYGNLTISREE